MEWMGKYSEISELVIKVMNEYSSVHKKQMFFNNENSLSFSEVQVLEEILRNKDSNMTDLSIELGVTKAAITKTMKKLETKGYISRYKLLSNNKNILVSVTDLGNEIYGAYQEFIYNALFKELFEIFDNESEDTLEVLKKFFDAAHRSIYTISNKNKD